MDKDGDGVVTPEEFIEHASAQEACDAGGCAPDDAGASLRGSEDEEAATAGA